MSRKDYNNRTLNFTFSIAGNFPGSPETAIYHGLIPHFTFSIEDNLPGFPETATYHGLIPNFGKGET